MSSLLDIAHKIFSSTEFGSDFLIELVVLMIVFTFFDLVANFTNVGKR